MLDEWEIREVWINRVLKQIEDIHDVAANGGEFDREERALLGWLHTELVMGRDKPEDRNEAD
jgi:hypothetical protein